MTASVARFIESFIPENYNLFLDINRSEKTFTGNVAITGEALDNHISLHQKDLTISSVLLDNESLNFKWMMLTKPSILNFQRPVF